MRGLLGELYAAISFISVLSVIVMLTAEFSMFLVLYVSSCFV